MTWYSIAYHEVHEDHEEFTIKLYRLLRFKARGRYNLIKALMGKNSSLAPGPIGMGPEGEVRLRLFSNYKFGQYQLSD